jgi:hypothetical protein
MDVLERHQQVHARQFDAATILTHDTHCTTHNYLRTTCIAFIISARLDRRDDGGPTRTKRALYHKTKLGADASGCDRKRNVVATLLTDGAKAATHSNGAIFFGVKTRVLHQDHKRIFTFATFIVGAKFTQPIQLR